MFIKAEEEGRELTVAGSSPREVGKHSSSISAGRRPRRSRPQDNSQLARSAQRLAAGSHSSSAGSHSPSAGTSSGNRRPSGSSVSKSSGGLIANSVQ